MRKLPSILKENLAKERLNDGLVQPLNKLGAIPNSPRFRILIHMANSSDLPLDERVKKLEERVDQLLELLQIVPRMDTKSADFSTSSEYAKAIFLTKLSEILEDPSIAPQEPFGH